MRLTRLCVDNLFSFDHLDLDLGAEATVILGPNGAGKTNVLRALDLAATALRWAAEERSIPWSPPPLAGPAGRSLQAFFGMSHQGRSGSRRVELGIELDQDEEISLLARFLRAAITWSLRDELQGSSADAPLEAWAGAEITPERATFLARGSLVAEHSGVPGRSWQVGYDFALGQDGSPCRWILAGPPLQDCIVRLDEGGRLPRQPYPQPRGLLHALFGLALGAPPPPLPDPLPAFDVENMIGPDPVGPITLGRPGRTPVDWSSPTVLEFVTDFGAPPPPTDMLPTDQAWSLADVLHRLWQKAVFTVGEALRGVGRWGEPVAAVGSYDLAQLAASPATSEPALLPARVFQLGNGSYEERARLEATHWTFNRLTGGRSFAVRLTPLPSRPVPDPAGGGATVPPQGAGGVFLEVLVTEDRTTPSDVLEVPIQFYGAGTWEALVLSEALSGPPGRVVLLDEPATNLHPSWQRVLREVLTGDRTAPGRDGPQVVLITHAADLVPLDADEATTLVRITRSGLTSEARQVLPRDLRGVARKLAAKGNERLLFVGRAVLVEGEDDRDVLQILAEGLGLGIETPDCALLECGGRGNLPDYISLCGALGIAHFVLMDGDSTKARRAKGVQRHVDQVREAIESTHGTLFEFEEAIEQAFGLSEKNPEELRKRAANWHRRDSSYPEVTKLISRLERFLGHAKRSYGPRSRPRGQ
jgi:hypothetical protein